MHLSQDRITLRQPDDWHLHLRDGDILNTVISPTAKVVKRAVIMPNLQPPITSIQSAISYRERIKNAIPKDLEFEPLMTI